MTVLLFTCSAVVALQKDGGIDPSIDLASFVNGERLARQPVHQLVFARLGGHAAFGNPGLAAEPQPWGHIRTMLGKTIQDLHGSSYGAYAAYATIQPSRDNAVGIFTNLGGGQDLNDAVAQVALRMATRVATNVKPE